MNVIPKISRTLIIMTACFGSALFIFLAACYRPLKESGATAIALTAETQGLEMAAASPEAPLLSPGTAKIPDSVAKEPGHKSASTHLPIVMYHYVEYVKDPKDVLRHRMNVNPDVLGVELAELERNGFATAFAREIPAVLEGTLDIGGRGVVLTFDDGYEDFYTDVFPLLKKYKAKATVYVMFDYIGQPGYLSSEQIKELLKSGLVEIGSHTLHHANLSKLSDEEAVKEIGENKRRLEQEFGESIMTFAYPYGFYGTTTPALVKQAGYSAALTTKPGFRHSPDDLFVLTRVRSGSFDQNTIIKFLETKGN